MPRRKLLITVDVEAQPKRATHEHVRKLIWGHYPGSQVVGGIDAMMRIAERHRVQLVMFLDFCESEVYGDVIRDTGEQIACRGHDLQLHAHPEFLSASFWSDRALSRPSGLNAFTYEQSSVLFEYLCEQYSRVSSQSPIAFRGGGYRYNNQIIRAIVDFGVSINSSYNAGRANQTLNLGSLPQFAYPNGCIELPVSCINPFRNLTRNVEMNFNASALNTATRMSEFLDTFFDQHGDDAIAVLVMHSWSFSHLDANGIFGSPDQCALDRFDEFLAQCAIDVQLLTTKDVFDLQRSNQLSLSRIVDYEAFDVIIL